MTPRRNEPLPAWLRARTQGADEPRWLAEMNAQPKVDGAKILRELEEAASQLDQHRAEKARRHEKERRAADAAWERAHQERDGRIPIAASLGWWAAQPPMTIW